MKRVPVVDLGEYFQSTNSHGGGGQSVSEEGTESPPSISVIPYNSPRRRFQASVSTDKEVR